MKKKTYTIIKTIILFILLFTIKSIFVSILGIFNIKFVDLSYNWKNIISFVINIIYMLILFINYRKTIIKDFKKFKNNILDNLETAFKYWLVGVIIMVISNLIIITIIKLGIANNEEVIRELIDKAPLYMLFSTIIYAPFTEELVFRKGFKDVFTNKNIYILVSSITFGVLHIIDYVYVTGNPIYFIHSIPYCALGLSFAYMYTKTNNIFSSMSMHLMHNSFAIILYLLGSAI